MMPERTDELLDVVEWVRKETRALEYGKVEVTVVVNAGRIRRIDTSTRRTKLVNRSQRNEDSLT